MLIKKDKESNIFYCEFQDIFSSLNSDTLILKRIAIFFKTQFSKNLRFLIKYEDIGTLQGYGIEIKYSKLLSGY